MWLSDNNRKLNDHIKANFLLYQAFLPVGLSALTFVQNQIIYKSCEFSFGIITFLVIHQITQKFYNSCWEKTIFKGIISVSNIFKINKLAEFKLVNSKLLILPFIGFIMKFLILVIALIFAVVASEATLVLRSGIPSFYPSYYPYAYRSAISSYYPYAYRSGYYY